MTGSSTRHSYSSLCTLYRTFSYFVRYHFVILYFASLPFFSSCSLRPDSVLSNRQMTEVLVDIHTAEGVLQVAGYNYGHDNEVKAFYATILDRHGITQAQFDSSIVWYTDHPQYFQRVYPKVLKQLQQQHDDETKRLTALDEELKQALQDSIRHADGSIRLSAKDIELRYREGLPFILYKDPEPVVLCTDTLYTLTEDAKEETDSETEPEENNDNKIEL